MLELLKQPWPWYTSGAAIAFIMVLLLFYGKSFGISSNLRTLCTLAGAGKKVKFFDFDWRTQQWNLLFLLGAVLGGVIASTVLKSEQPLDLSPATIQDLQKIGVAFDGQLNPSQLFGLDFVNSPKGFLILLIGGALVGFGARYAGGCTSSSSFINFSRVL